MLTKRKTAGFFGVVSACGLMVVDQQPLEPMLQ
jgi:hypothetical protein